MKQFGFHSDSRAVNEADINVWYSDTQHSDTTAIIVNYADGGFVLVNPNTNSQTQVYAVSDNGSYLVGVNPYADEYVYALAGLGGTIGGGDNDTLPKQPVIGFPSTMIRPDDIYISYNIPKWCQENPFNRYCFTEDGEQAVVGCVALSMGQICSYP